MSTQRETTWFLQACEDLLWAKSSFKSGHFAQVCFIAQQVGEKALKALAFGRDAVEVRGHSITKLAAALEINGDIQRCARALDAYYISARYPDAYPEGLPSEYLKAEEASEAISFAEIILARAANELGKTIPIS